MAQPQLILASASPRRRELLAQIGVHPIVRTADIDESAREGETPFDLVSRLAQEKAETVWQASDRQLPVLGADTLGVLDGKLLVKPMDFADARAMLLHMSGRQHEILSAVALRHNGGCGVAVNQSRVWFRDISEAEIMAYWEQGEPRDKAGAYAIQGLGAVFVGRLEGSFSAVMGLPLFETARLLQTAGITLLA